jgi:murein L,D-transpeptidase YcbB/YkuD
VVDVSELNEVARAGAELAIAGGMTLTSGRRSVPEQAHAMASNVVHNLQWIKETYVDNAVSEACQKWVDEHEDEAKEVDSCAKGLLETLDSFSDDERRHISWHLSGDAFDCEPDGNEAHLKLLEEIVEESIASGGTAKFLSQEGGLTRWHVQMVGGSPPKGKPKAAEVPSHSGPAYPGSTLHRGMSGEEVKVWQERLVELGHSIQADGEFGQATEEATKSLQSAKGLDADGVVGEHTWAAAWS